MSAFAPRALSRQALPAGGSCWGGRPGRPTALRCSRQGRAAELTARPAVAPFRQPRQVGSRSALARADPGAVLLVAPDIAPSGQRLPRPPPVLACVGNTRSGSAKAGLGKRRCASAAPTAEAKHRRLSGRAFAAPTAAAKSSGRPPDPREPALSARPVPATPPPRSHRRRAACSRSPPCPASGSGRRRPGSWRRGATRRTSRPRRAACGGAS